MNGSVCVCVCVCVCRSPSYSSKQEESVSEINIRAGSQLALDGRVVKRRPCSGVEPSSSQEVREQNTRCTQADG